MRGIYARDNTWSKLQIIKLTSLSLFPSQLMEFHHMPKELDDFNDRAFNDLSDRVLSYWFPTRKSSQAGACRKTRHEKKHERGGTQPNEDVI